MSEYIITDKGMGFDMEDALAEGGFIKECVVRCRECLSFDKSKQSELNEQAFYCRHRCSYELEDGWCYMGVRA